MEQQQPTAQQIQAGHAVYSKRLLPTYDFIVLSISNRYIWQCSTSNIERLFEQHLSANHLDVGVGTGYFLDRCKFPAQAPRVALMDIHPDALTFASERIARYSPERYKQNILEPITDEIKPFDSISINYLLHCLPGSIQQKTELFDHVKPLMNSGATIFGSTILQGGVDKNFLARQLMAVYNSKGIFSNTQDDLESLSAALHARFDDVNIDVIGCVALFAVS